MPFINHKNLGDVQKHAYLKGTITQTYPESDEVPEEYWDTADVLIEGYEYVWEHAPIFYHCYNDAKIRENGAIVDGAKGFTANSKVVIICEIITPIIGAQRQIDNVKVTGHQDGPVKCAYNYVLIRCGLSEIEAINFTDEEENAQEQCVIFDVLLKAPAKIPDPDNPEENLIFPCPVNKVKSFLLNIDFNGVEMWEIFDQGDSEIQIAGGVPNWTSDISGDDIRGSAEASEWWTSYDVNGNPIQNFFEDTCLALMTDDAGASAGTYNKAQAIIDAAESDIKKWESRSSGFVTDSREYPVTGCPDLKLDYAIDPDGFLLDPATSKHIQAAYGENEIWMCIVNSYMGLIVEYCDASNKFVRTPRLYDAIPIPGVISNYETVANDAALAANLPSGIASGKLIGDIGMALAASITLTGKGNENNLFSWATLKRVNEGAYHRTIHPAITGSKVIRSTKIPEDTTEEPRYLSAINFRKDIINAWYRYDNWNNTFNYITYSFGVSPTWWFRSLAQQFGCDTVYVDTPIGSMWYQAPNWKGFVYYLYAVQTGQVTMTARQDKFIKQVFNFPCKHSANVACQVYVVQRTAITLWSIQQNVFVKQTAGINPYDTIPILEDGQDPVAYALMPDSTYKHFDLLTPEDLETLISDRVFLYSNSPDQNKSLRQNRNEIEIMASADFYSDLYANFSRRNPVDQERCPELEAELAKLIQAVTMLGESKFSPFYLDMEIL